MIFHRTGLLGVRILLHGHSAASYSGNKDVGIRELAYTLSQSLVTFRGRTQTEERPLCFLCHGLGGVIVKKSLSFVRQQYTLGASESTTSRSGTHGVSLFRVQALESQYNQLRTMLEQQPPDGLSNEVLTTADGGQPDFFCSLTLEFEDLDRRLKSSFEIVSYYEMKPTLLDKVGIFQQSLKLAEHRSWRGR